VVRRSAALWAGAGRPYSAAGAPFAHGEYALVRGWFGALLTKVLGVLLGALLFRPWFFPCVARWLPKPGEGPSDAQISRNWFVYLIRASVAPPAGGGGGRVAVWARVAGGDPGYGETAKMLAEAGVLLAGSAGAVAALPGKAVFGGGFLTPATAFGGALTERLHAQGITFEEVLEKDVEAAAGRGWRAGGSAKAGARE
jgi:short subunit dehydrogenase-like uncharacterized protein